MQPDTDKDKMPPDAETDTAPQNSGTATLDELDLYLHDFGDSVRRAQVHFLPAMIKPLVLYTLIHIAFIQQVSMLLGRQFLIPIFFMFFLECLTEIRLEHTKLVYEKAIVAIRLSCDNVIENSNASMKNLIEGSQAMKDLAQSSIGSLYEFQKSSQEHREAFVQSEAYRKEDILNLRKETNEMRLAYFRVYFTSYETLVDSIEQMVKKVKTMAAQPKVKGTKRNSNNRNNDDSNALTVSLEHVAADLKQRQITTKKQIAVAEKIKAILEREGLLPEEIDRLVQDAEGDLQHPQDASLLQPPSGSRTPNTGVSPAPLGEGMDKKLEKHYKDLDKWFQSVQDRPIVEDKGT